MSATPTEPRRRRLHEALGLCEPTATPSVDAARQRARRQRAVQLRETARRRDATFGAELFAEPAFDLLLDLYLVEHGVPADRASPGANWRCFAAMEDRGLVERARDGDDPRRARLRLTVEAVEAMERLLDSCEPARFD